jgi:endoglucanase
MLAPPSIRETVLRKDSKSFLVRLLNAPAPSGFEAPAQRVWREYVEPLVDRVEIDVYGSNTAILEGKGAISVMVVGHADEVGLIVKRIDEKGMLWFGKIGGVDPVALVASRVRVLSRTGEIPGVVGAPAIHLVPPASAKKPELADLCIDIGAAGRKEVEKLVRVGDPVIFGEDFRDLAGGFASHRAFDNRMGCFVVAEMLRKLAALPSARRPRATVYGVSSVQEETGVWGAGLVAERYAPSLAVAVDVTHDTSTPGISKTAEPDVVCGKGPVLTRGIRTNRAVGDLLEKTARAAKIPLQLEVDEGKTGTDADPISARRTGIPVASVSVACRYMHTPCEVLHLDDLEKTSELLARFVARLPEKLDLVPR